MIRLKNPRLFSSFFEFTIYVVTSLITLFIYANVAEKLFLIDLPIVKTVRTELTPALFLSSEQLQIIESMNNSLKYGFIGKPILLKFPRKNILLPLLESVKTNGGYSAVYDSLSYIISQETMSGRPKEILIFGSQDDKLLSFVFALSLGDRLVVQTAEGWLVHYKVLKTQLTSNVEYLSQLSSSQRLVLVKEVEKGNYLIIEAEFLSLEEML